MIRGWKSCTRIPIEGMGIRIRFINTFETAAMILIYVAGLVSLIRYIVFIKIWNIPAISPAKAIIGMTNQPEIKSGVVRTASKGFARAESPKTAGIEMIRKYLREWDM